MEYTLNIRIFKPISSPLNIKNSNIASNLSNVLDEFDENNVAIELFSTNIIIVMPT